MNKMVSKNSEQVIVQVSKSIIALANECIAKTGKFTIALSGGNTPKLLYQHLITVNLFESMDTSKLYFYFSDERFVAHDDDRSNYGLAKNNLFNKVDIPEGNIFPVNTSFDKVEDSAKNYQDIITKNITNNKRNIPEFDLVILGIGEDGHTASLFPGSELLSANDIFVGSCSHSDSNTDRISFTFPLINAAKKVFIIAIGKGKSEIIKNIKKLEQDNLIRYPVQQVNPDGDLVWFIDEAADGGG